MGSCAAPSAKGDDKFITTDYLQQCPYTYYLSHLYMMFSLSLLSVFSASMFQRDILYHSI
ncbi:hypothetical protein AM395_28215 (plasmid) [Klebsiella pneumoniae]|nr:hypothetical protein AM395_28215 [Klebsiella pneumoniae]